MHFELPDSNRNAEMVKAKEELNSDIVKQYEETIIIY